MQPDYFDTQKAITQCWELKSYKHSDQSHQVSKIITDVFSN